MTDYKFVTKEDIDDRCTEDLKVIANRLLEEREAYRKVAIAYQSLISTDGTSDERQVDLNARRILGNK